MVLECPHCNYSVGEESCSGCRRNIRYYKCSRCKGIVPNTKYASGVTCLKCGAEVFEDINKGNRQYHRYYVCQACEAIVENPKFTHDHPCENCEPPHCNECGAYTALHIGLRKEVCIKCGTEYPLNPNHFV